MGLGQSGEVKNPGKFIYVSIGEPQYLDPAVDYETGGGEILQNVYETLIWYNGSSVEDLKPMLATEVPSIANGLISADGLNYTFNLRSDVQFHDGTTMDADDVVYSFHRVLRIHSPAGPSWMLEQVLTDYISYYIGDTVGDWLGDSFNASWLYDALPDKDPFHVLNDADVRAVSEASVEKVDDDTVVFHLTHPYPGFLQILAYTVGSIVSNEYVEANGGIVDGEHNDWMDQHTCGTGPYKLVEWDVGTGVYMTRNDDYWGTAPSIKDVFILLATDVNTRMIMLQAGDADAIDLSIEYEYLFQGADYRISKGLLSFDMMFAGFNFNINAAAAATLYGSDVPSDFFHDKNVRKAFTCLINYTLYIQSVRNGNAMQVNGPIPQGMFGFNASIPYYEYDLTAAENYFKAAINKATGNSWWDDGFTIALIYNAGNTYRETACQFMKQALESMASPGGFSANVFALDWPSYLNTLQQYPSPFPLFWLGWGPDYADPDDYVTPFLDSAYGVFPHAYTGYVNTTIDTLVRQAAAELDEDVRYQLYSNISMLCYEDAPYIWFYQALNFHVERSWVSGYYFNPMYSNLYYAALSKPNSPPNASFIVSPLYGDITTIFTVDASGSSDIEDSPIDLSVRWDWENDSIWDTSWSTTKTAQHQYTEEGEYTIRLEVRDTYLLTHNTTRQVTVYDSLPIANAGSDQTVEEGTLVTFDGSASYDDVNIVNYTWSFVDVSLRTLYGIYPTYLFDTPGIYTVTLNVTDTSEKWDKDTVVITVEEIIQEDTIPPIADAGSDQTVFEDTIVTFNGNGSSDNVGISEFSWTFIDATAVTLNGANPTYVFDSQGTYTITLNVTDAAGNWDTDEVVYIVKEKKAEAKTTSLGEYWWVIGIIIAIIAALIVLMIVFRKRPPIEPQ